MCERAPEGEKGMITIYEIINSKKRAVLPDDDKQKEAYQSQEFVAAAFNPKLENQIVTLCGQPDWTVLLWDWEKLKLLCKVSLGLKGPIVSQPAYF